MIMRERYKCVPNISVHVDAHKTMNDPLLLHTRDWPSRLSLQVSCKACTLTSAHVRTIVLLRQSRANLYIAGASASRIQFI